MNSGKGSGVSDFCHSHSNHVLDVEVLQGGHVWVVTLVILQDDLLDDAVQEKPVLYGVPTALICHTETSDKGKRPPHISVNDHEHHNAITHKPGGQRSI